MITVSEYRTVWFHFSATTTWFGASCELNKTDILQNIHEKTTAEYEQARAEEYKRTQARIGKYPEFSEYVDRFQQRNRLPGRMTRFVFKIFLFLPYGELRSIVLRSFSFLLDDFYLWKLFFKNVLRRSKISKYQNLCSWYWRFINV